MWLIGYTVKKLRRSGAKPGRKYIAKADPPPIYYLPEASGGKTEILFVSGI
jgi:hypothetical protein